MNYQGDLSSVYTLAHELAHSMHRYFATENQPYTDSKYDVIVAETVSKVNELLLTDYLLNLEEFSDIRHRIIDNELEGIRGTFYVQSMFADFQEQIYDRVEEEGGITSQEADRMYAELKYKYYDGVQENQYTGKGWMAVHHFYLDFYVFKYATGISAAKKIVEQIKTGEEGRERYINFLKAGGSKYPIEALRDVGADLENPELFEKIVERYKDFQQEYKDEVQQG